MRNRIESIIKKLKNKNFPFDKKKYFFFKRIFDFFLALVLLILLHPLFILITILNLPSTFFFQKRVGYKGRVFFIIKFRTMKNNTNFKSWNTRENDPRITFLGKILRKTSLDELPQLLNILIGDMSFVGPRPDLPLQVRNLKKDEALLRLSVLPGITGLSQVSGRSKLSYLERLYYDLLYVEKASFIYDFNILLRTLSILFRFSYSR